MTALVTAADLLGIARHHQQHERYYAAYDLEVAAELRRSANTLKGLADHWSRTVAAGEVAPSDERYRDPRLQGVGCPDLNDLYAISHVGVLFMEGESEPRELVELRDRVRHLATHYESFGAWLTDKMVASWEREGANQGGPLLQAMNARYKALVHTTNSAYQMTLAGRVLHLAHAGLTRIDLHPQALRENLLVAAVSTRNVGWLLDEAATVVAEQAVKVAASDGWWHEFISHVDQDAE